MLRLELVTGLPTPITSNFDSVFFYNKMSVNLKVVHLCGGLWPQPEECAELLIWS